VSATKLFSIRVQRADLISSQIRGLHDTKHCCGSLISFDARKEGHSSLDLWRVSGKSRPTLSDVSDRR
jgi:hypothetical protein